MAATKWATRPSEKTGRLVWDKKDLKALHSRIKKRAKDVPVMDVCKDIAAEMAPDVPGITAHKLYQRAYFYDSSLEPAQRFIDTTRSRRSVQGAQVRAGTAKPKAQAAPKPKRAKAKRHKPAVKAVPVIEPLVIDPLTAVSNMLDQLRGEKAAAEARAAAAEARADKLAGKLDRVHKLSA